MLLLLRSLFNINIFSFSTASIKLFVGLLILFASGSGHAQRLSVQLNDGEGNPVNGAVIEILLPEEMRAAYRSKVGTEVDQLDKEFTPHVSTVIVGNSVTFPNSDDILHHVYSFSPISTFNIPLYGKGIQDDYNQVFDTAGVIEIGCNIHDWMLAYIYVSETSLNAISDDSGQAILESIPSGTFELRIWHPRLAEQDIAMTHTIEFIDGEQTKLDYTLELQRDRRIRRAPSSGRSRYR